jgi:hypothetical protein
MCGIVGLIARKQCGFRDSDLTLFEGMLLLDQLRGEDSTGVFGVDRQRRVGGIKVASHPNHLFACEDWASFRSKSVQSGRILIGHNRKATQGSITSKNAHPFHENNIVLVHNGTLQGHKDLADTDVDSHAICHAFNEQGAENVIPTLKGAFALVWWDIEKNRLFAVRNDERPLNIVITDDVVAIASEAWMATCLLSRAGTKVEKLIPIEAGDLYEFDLKGEFSSKKLNLPQKLNNSTTTHTNTGAKGAASGNGNTVTTGETNLSKKPESASPPSNGGSCAVLPFNGAGRSFEIDPEFPKGTRVLVKLASFQAHLLEGQDTGKVKMFGRIMHPGKTQIDCIGWATKEDAVKFLDEAGWCEASILNVAHSTCGRSAYINDVTKPDSLKVHNTFVWRPEWEHIKKNCFCKRCKAVVTEDDLAFTKVIHIGGNKNEIQITCPECVEDELEAEAKTEFSERRAGAVQNGERVSEESRGDDLPKPQGKGSPTLH